MIENDVRLDFRQNLGFFDRLPASDADLLAFQVWKALTLWFWYAPLVVSRNWWKLAGGVISG
ncbi:hypothetical protein [Paracoccus kondratievae]|uniref:Uncharacterized protein n=1 Tax=Paracoccus kondratievae TaxID=135740 RepID=A0AAD3RUY9_9RHOB|nr:hypothetical protein [Paracoccus kondratievae]GLK65296.1 hypothetical protein GCM10017635_27700 [Paracoccus kondratievae]